MARKTTADLNRLNKESKQRIKESKAKGEITYRLNIPCHYRKLTPQQIIELEVKKSIATVVKLHRSQHEDLRLRAASKIIDVFALYKPPASQEQPMPVYFVVNNIGQAGQVGIEEREVMPSDVLKFEKFEIKEEVKKIENEREDTPTIPETT